MSGFSERGFPEPEDMGLARPSYRARRLSDIESVDALCDWDIWLLDPSNYTLVAGRWEIYYVDLEDCTTSAQTLDWIAQIAHKTWATPPVLAGLVHALDEVLRPQATLCSSGQSKSLSTSRIRALVKAFAQKHPEVLVDQEVAL